MQTNNILQWTPTTIQTLLQNPQRLLQHPEWQAYIQQFGGLSGFYTYLQTLRLNERQRNLLKVITEHPKASVLEYCRLLHIHTATFHRHQRDLWQSLSMQLNTEAPVTEAQPKPANRLNLGMRSRLPNPLTPLIGRSQEIAFIHNLLQQSARLITLTGIGGIGKTRLAIQLAHELEAETTHQIYFCSFVDIRQPAAALPFLARHLDLNHQAQTDDIVNLLIDYFAEWPSILILDNLEHILSIVPTFSKILQQAPHLKIIATSRVRLNLYGEHIVPIQGLSFPNLHTRLALSDLNNFDSSRLFINRAQAINPFFQVDHHTIEAIQAICYKLDGIPLALEFAAGHCNQLTAEEIVIGLSERFELLTNSTNDAEERHQTLYTTLEWSYQLLEPETKYILDQLGIFQAPWDIQLTYALFPQFSQAYVDQHMHILIEHQFLKRILINDLVVYMMFETIRDYVQQKFNKLSNQLTIQQAVVTYFHHYLRENPYNELNKNYWLNQISIYYPHIIQILELIDQSVNDQRFSEIIHAIIPYWTNNYYFFDGMVWCKKSIDRNNNKQTIVDATINYHYVIFYGYYWNNDINDKNMLIDYLNQSIEIAQKYDNQDLFISDIHNHLGNIYALYQNDIALMYYRKSLSTYKKYKLDIDMGRVYNNIGNLFRLDNRPEKSLPFYQKCINIFRISNEFQKLSIALGNYSGSLRVVNRIGEAVEAINEALIYTQENNDLQSTTLNLMYLYEIKVLTKQLDEAEALIANAQANVKILRTKFFDQWIAQAQQKVTELRQKSGHY